MNHENEQTLPSTRPYLIRAMHEWCTDNGFSPYMAVHVDRSVQVPLEFVNNGEIVLNVSHDATSGLRIGNDWIEFKARFGGVARDILVPVTHVVAIYARENGQGMAFPPPELSEQAPEPAPEGHTPEEGAGADEGRAVPRGPQLRAVPSDDSQAPDPGGDGSPDPGGPKGGRRPALKRVK